MKAIRKFTVRAVLPKPLAALEELAGNLRWSWHEPTRQLFERIAPELWREIGTDPVALLGAVDPRRLDELAQNHDYVAEVNATRDALRDYLEQPRWYQGIEGEKPAARGGHTVMRDRVYYAPPLGPLGGIAHALFVRRTLARIFGFRHHAVTMRFGRGDDVSAASRAAP